YELKPRYIPRTYAEPAQYAPRLQVADKTQPFAAVPPAGGGIRTPLVGSQQAPFGWNFTINPATPSSEMGADMMKLSAFFLAPVPAAITGALVSWASGGFPRPVSLAIFYLLLLYVGQIVFGLAICAYLLRKNRRSAMQFGIGGLVMTSVPTALYLAWATAKHPAPAATALLVFALWSALGAMTGLCYWLLTQRHGGRS
ncbi:hypothetical protein OSJ57_26655, partial [Sphingomonas sp. HH69]